MKLRFLILLLTITSRLLLAQTNPAAAYKTFTIGVSNSPGRMSWVLPFDQVKGVAFDSAGNVASQAFNGNDWTTTNFHVNASNPLAPFEIRYPLTAFGSKSGGTPLYTSRSYIFQVAFGDSPKDSTENANAMFQVVAYNKANMSVLGTVNITVPVSTNQPNFGDFRRDGATIDQTAWGLHMEIRPMAYAYLPLVFEIKQVSTRADLVFLVKGQGWTSKNDTDYDGRPDQIELIDGTDPLDSKSVIPSRLLGLRFEGATTNEWLKGDKSQMPWNFKDIQVASASGTGRGQYLTATTVTPPNATPVDQFSLLNYFDIQANGRINIRCDRGTVRYWFKPNWGSITTGPAYGRALEVGNWSADGTSGYFGLQYYPLMSGASQCGEALSFVRQGWSTNHNSYLSPWYGYPSACPASIALGWHHYTVVYSTNCTMYIDGSQVGAWNENVTLLPDALARAYSGLRLVSANGQQQANGYFDDIETFNYEFTASEVSKRYAMETDSNAPYPGWALDYNLAKPTGLTNIVLRSTGGSGNSTNASITVNSLTPTTLGTSGFLLVRLGTTGSVLGTASYDLASAASADSLASELSNAVNGTILAFVSCKSPATFSNKLLQALNELGFATQYRWSGAYCWYGIAQKGRGHPWVEKVAEATSGVTQLDVNFSLEAYFDAISGVRQPVVKNAQGQATWLPLFVTDFEDLPPWRSSFIDKPRFNLEPLPAEYEGKAVEEVTNAAAIFPNPPAYTAGSYTNLDLSPELRRHQVLDQLVADLRNDPLAIATYVQNEIGLIDCIDYNTNITQQISLDVGGMNRGAYGTLIEGAGSPLEQCALLVYMLRQAGVPAAYAYGPTNGMKILSSTASSLLGVQLEDKGVPHLVQVNYPWVVANVSGSWVHLFPWLKDIEVRQGPRVTDYLHTNYNTSLKWLGKYLASDPAIMNLIPTTDLPSLLWPKFVENQIQLSGKRVSYDELGTKVMPRKRGFAKLTDLPQPFIAPASLTVQESMKDTPQIFNTISVTISSKQDPSNTSKMIKTGLMRLVELNNRYLYVKWSDFPSIQPTLVLGPWKDSATAVNSFVPIDNAGFETGRVWEGKEQASAAFSGTDTAFVFEYEITRWRSTPWTIVTSSNPWGFYFGQSTIAGSSPLGAVGGGMTAFDQAEFPRGTAAALSMNFGGISPAMLDRYVSTIQKHRNNLRYAAPTVQSDVDVVLGCLLHLMGLSYQRQMSDFSLEAYRKFNWAQLSRNSFGFFCMLPNSSFQPTYPLIHFTQQDSTAIFNGRPSGLGRIGMEAFDGFLISSVAASALEHGVIDQYFKTSGSGSTVKFLRVGTPTGFVELNRQNYESWGAANTTLTNTILWEKVVKNLRYDDFARVVFNKADVSISSGFYGRGVLVINGYGGAGAYISCGYNGGQGKAQTPITGSDSQSTDAWLDDDGNPMVIREGTTKPSSPKDQTSQRPTEGDSTQNSPDAYNPQNTSLQQRQAAVNGTSTLGIKPAVDNKNNKGDIPKTAGKGGFLSWVADPVNVVSGEFWVDAVDLKLPGPFPLEVRRTYGSQNEASGLFGYGWKLNYNPYLLMAHNAADNGVESIYVAELDGSVSEFEYEPIYAPATKYVKRMGTNPQWKNLTENSIGGSGNSWNDIIVKTVSGPDTFYVLNGNNGSKRTYRVRSFPITSGTSTLDRQRPYLEEWKDNRGNFHSFSYGIDPNANDYGQLRRIQSSNGNYLVFRYDQYGCVTEIFSGDGRHLYYEYDQYADLVKTTLPDGSVIRYDYQQAVYTTNSVGYPYSTHLLTQEFKPNGRMLVNQYDSLRRVKLQMSTVGADMRLYTNATFNYSTTQQMYPQNKLTGFTEVFDAYTNKTKYEYTDNLITKITDPLNQTITQEWYFDALSDWTPPAFPRSLKSSTDKRGLKTDYQYDSRGNITNTVVTGDLTGAGVMTETATTRVQYNTQNLITKTIEPNGTTNSLVYDSTNPYLLIQKYSSPVGSSGLLYPTLLEYTNVSQLVTNGTTLATNAAFGLVNRLRAFSGSPDATDESFTFDGRGWLTSKTTTTGTSDPNLTETFVYNDRGEVTSATDAVGRSSRFTYDNLGKPRTKELYEAGATTPLWWEYRYYNQNGELEWFDGPKRDPEDFTRFNYDAAGRMVEEIKWRSQAKADGSGVEAPLGDDRYSTTFHEFDLFGNEKKVRYPLGNSDTMLYDGIGQMLSRIRFDSNGVALSTNLFAYEPGGKVRLATNALGGVTTSFYTSAGALKEQRNPDGSIFYWRYYADGTLWREYQRNGSYWERAYDYLNRKVTRQLKNAAGTVLGTEFSEADRRGNLVKKTDMEGGVWLKSYDRLNRSITETGPTTSSFSAQQSGTTSYIQPGKRVIKLNGLGEKTVTLADALGRTLGLQVFDSAGVLVRATSTAYAADHNSYTVTEGTNSTTLATTVFTDNEGRAVVQAYNGGSEKSVNRYDWAGNVIDAKDELGISTQFGYNGFNLLKQTTTVDGAVKSYLYNPAGELARLLMGPSGVASTNIWDNAGRLQQSMEVASTGINASTDWLKVLRTYATTAGKPVGLPETETDSRGYTHTLVYDDWMMVISETWKLGANPVEITVNRAHDKLGRITLVEEITAAGTTRVERSFSSYGQTVEEVVKVDGSVDSHLRQQWDAAGRRVRVWQPEPTLVLGNGTGSDFITGWRADGTLKTLLQGSQSLSFTYGNQGLLESRQTPWRNRNVTLRDGRGRAKQYTTQQGGSTILQEDLTWRADSRLNTYQPSVSLGVAGGTWTYNYNSRKQLTSETLANGSVTWQKTLGYDASTKLGVLSQVSNSGWLNNSWNGGFDTVIGRVNSETTGTAARSRWMRGYAANAQAMYAWLDNPGTPLSVLYDRLHGEWQVQTAYGTGSHGLTVKADHPWDFVSGGSVTRNSATVSNAFSLAASSPYTPVYDQMGNASQSAYRTHTWDARGRLKASTDSSGLNWSARYDGLGRRLRVLEVYPTGTNRIDSWFDPQVEFMEVAVAYNGERWWHVRGPDRNDSYGGLQGIGGLEGAVRERDGQVVGSVNNHFGDVMGWVINGNVTWSSVPLTSHGPAIGYEAERLSWNFGPVESARWRGKRQDATGLYWMGARYYDSDQGRFISPDPLSREASGSLYDYADNDPVNGLDPDGRLAKGVISAVVGAANIGLAVAKTPLIIAERSVFGLLTDQASDIGGHLAKNFENAFESGANFWNLAKNATVGEALLASARQVPVVGNFVPGPTGQMDGDPNIFITGGINGGNLAESYERDKFSAGSINSRAPGSEPKTATYAYGTATDVLFSMVFGNTAQGLDYANQVASQMGTGGTILADGHSGGVMRQSTGSVFLGMAGIGVSKMFSEQGPGFGLYNNVDNLSANYSIGKDITSNFGAFLGMFYGNMGELNRSYSPSNNGHRQTINEFIDSRNQFLNSSP